MNISIVLVTPLIPQNTGNLARLTAAMRTRMHLIEPLGFELSDRYLKRAGLDYWSETDIVVHPSWNAFLEQTGATAEQLWLFSARAESSFHTKEYKLGDYLVFGNETKGLPEELHQQYADRKVRIPIDNPKIRSLNLANSAAIALFEARRQNNLLR